MGEHVSQQASGGRRYRLISSDSHVNEPPNLWVDRVPAALKARAPRMESFDDGDAWMIEGVKDPINFGMNACAGLAPEDMKGWARFDEIRKGGWDPASRIAEMDEDGVDAEVLYPTPRLSAAIVANRDVDYHLAMVRAYNDWISEFVEYAPDRFGGLALLPNRGAEAAVAEGADYIGFGPLFATPTKPGRPAIGLDDIRRVHELVKIPIFCIGGIKLENLDAVLAAGAQRIVIVSFDKLLAVRFNHRRISASTRRVARHH